MIKYFCWVRKQNRTTDLHIYGEIKYLYKNVSAQIFTVKMIVNRYHRHALINILRVDSSTIWRFCRKLTVLVHRRLKTLVEPTSPTLVSVGFINGAPAFEVSLCLTRVHPVPVDASFEKPRTTYTLHNGWICQLPRSEENIK